MGTRQQKSPDYFRYCPGEERIKISDAVCVGRRRANFPKCKGCQFNDDEKAQAKPQTVPLRPAPERDDTQRLAEIFRAYDIRGRYPDPLDREVAWRIGHAVAQFLRSELRGYDRSRTDKSAVVVGRDMRKSSPELAEALIEGLRAADAPVIDIGMIDTPQLYFAVNEFTCCGGVQVTASHNPAQYNGFKICGLKGRPISEETGLTKICKIAANIFRQSGGALAELEQADVSQSYREFVRGFLDEAPPGLNEERPLRVVVDASNGMAGRWFPLLYGDIPWLQVVPLNFEHNGTFVHDPDPLVEANLAQLSDRVIRSKAHLGVCFDGDADRCILVDETGRCVRADWITALLARHFLKSFPGSTIVYDLRCSRVVADEIRKAGGVPRRERCGHVFIKKAMADSKALFGGELSGHFYFRDNWYCDSGVIAFAHLLNLLNSAGLPLSELVAPLKRYANSGERNFENEHAAGTLVRLTRRYADAEIDDLDGVTVQYPDWWFNVRSSNTESLLRLNLEAKDADLLEKKLAELYPLLGKPVSG